jgi:hypothetical protein
MRISCPHCKDVCRVRSSKRPAPVFYELYSQCTNPECGWCGKIHIEFARTTTPSRLPDPEVNIPLDRDCRAALLSQLQAN